MRGLEVVVRPVVFPNIRPAPARSLPPADDPDKGFAVIRGNGARQVSLSNSWSSSAQTSKRQETQRRVDEARVYQKEKDGKVNKGNFVDIEVPNKIWMKGAKEETPNIKDDSPYIGIDPGIEAGRRAMNRVDIEFYRPIQEADNIEVKKKNVIKRSGEETTSGPVE